MNTLLSMVKNEHMIFSKKFFTSPTLKLESLGILNLEMLLNIYIQKFAKV